MKITVLETLKQLGILGAHLAAMFTLFFSFLSPLKEDIRDIKEDIKELKAEIKENRTDIKELRQTFFLVNIDKSHSSAKRK